MKSYVVTGKQTSVSEKEVQRAYSAAKNDGATKYVGEWHNHPTKGGSWSMSPADVKSANSVQNQLSGEYRPFFSDPNLRVIEWDANATTVNQANSTNIDHGGVDEDE
jgi:hypothetical protein